MRIKSGDLKDTVKNDKSAIKLDSFTLKAAGTLCVISDEQKQNCLKEFKYPPKAIIKKKEVQSQKKKDVQTN